MQRYANYTYKTINAVLIGTCNWDIEGDQFSM